VKSTRLAYVILKHECRASLHPLVRKVTRRSVWKQDTVHAAVSFGRLAARVMRPLVVVTGGGADKWRSPTDATASFIRILSIVIRHRTRRPHHHMQRPL
jgi:hypothetical protein